MDEMVDALEDGKIVRVPMGYAKQEGLMILKKQENAVIPSLKIKEPSNEELYKRRTRSPLNLDRYRRPLNYKKNNVVAELMDNFHWEVIKARKSRNMTRKGLADALGIGEDDVKMIENGLLPKDDFILISRIEKFFNIDLRKSAEPVEEKKQEKTHSTKVKEEVQEMPEIEVFDD